MVERAAYEYCIREIEAASKTDSFSQLTIQRSPTHRLGRKKISSDPNLHEDSLCSRRRRWSSSYLHGIEKSISDGCYHISDSASEKSSKSGSRRSLPVIGSPSHRTIHSPKQATTVTKAVSLYEGTAWIAALSDILTGGKVKMTTLQTELQKYCYVSK